MITYKESGVDIDKGNRFVQAIGQFTSKLPKSNILSSIGSFSALYSLKSFGCDVVLSAATDGVGTKLKIAEMAGKHDSIGIDLVAMNVNDIITNGSTPAFFLDYISYSELKDDVLTDIIKGITDGLNMSRCALIGGETAQMPQSYRKGEYDLAGFCVGIAKNSEILQCSPNSDDIIIGISSSGFHSNGYSLLRNLFFDVGGYKIDSVIDGKPLSEILLKPTYIYVKVFNAIKQYVHAAAHITGGGFYENMPRVLKDNQRIIIEKSHLPEPDEFALVQNIGNLSDYEMYKTFNMGIGFSVFISREDKDDVMRIIENHGFSAYEIGSVIKGSKGLEIV